MKIAGVVTAPERRGAFFFVNTGTVPISVELPAEGPEQPTLAALVGKTIEAEGQPYQGRLLVEKWRER